MIRILTSLVAVLTVTSIQSQTSLSGLYSLLSQDQIDQLFDMHIDDLLNHSISQKKSNQLYNGGFITSKNENLDIIFTNTSIYFFHKALYNSYRKTSSYSSAALNLNLSKDDQKISYNNILYKNTVSYPLSPYLRSDKLSSSSNQISYSKTKFENHYTKKIIEGYQNPNILSISNSDKDWDNHTYYGVIKNNVPKTRRIRSPNTENNLTSI